MSNFACDKCGRTQVDNDGIGYVAGCSHYPPEHSDFVNVFFGGGEPPVKAFYSGAFYKSVLAMNQGRAVHPVYWESGRTLMLNRSRRVIATLPIDVAATRLQHFVIFFWSGTK